MKSRGHRLKSRVVIVAENFKKSRTFVCKLVEELNCDAVPAASALEVLELARSRRVDLVLLNIDLAWSKGQSTVDAIREIVPLLPIVVMSLQTTPALARRMCDRGVQSFLRKPVQRDQLAVTMFRYLL